MIDKQETVVLELPDAPKYGERQNKFFLTQQHTHWLEGSVKGVKDKAENL
jgi:hypothetical protein